MIEPRSWTYGNRNDFSFTLSFAPDPDQGRGASRSMSATWGSFEIWVNGLNLCLHREDDTTISAVHWYLLPLLRWFVTNWDFLLHEERLPNRNEGRDAWVSLRATAEVPISLTDQSAEDWGDLQHAWWSRHALTACREGGLFPDVVIRRMQDQIEFSWGPSLNAGTPQHFYFLSNHGYARIDPSIVANHLHSVIQSAIEHICIEMPDEPAFTKLLTEVQLLKHVDRSARQLSLICGLKTELRDVLLSQEVPQMKWSPSFDTGKLSRLVIVNPPNFCLMFGSVAPDITEKDVERLLELIRSIPNEAVESSLLRSLVRDEAIRSALEPRPWEQGYALAEEIHQTFGLNYVEDSRFNIEALVNDLGIVITSIELSDTSIRAIAIAGEHCPPTIAINNRYSNQNLHPRRFTLAHELCHILYDRAKGVRLALASGPWAPVDVEKRANAFAAMLLMPPELIQNIVEIDQVNIESVDGLWVASKKLGVSFSSLVEHLCNLRFLDEETRDQLKQEAIQNSAPKPVDSSSSAN